MKFEDIQKLWNEQNGERMYIVNDSELRKSVTLRKEIASGRINRVEIIVTIFNALASLFLIILAMKHPHALIYFNAAMMTVSVIFIQYFRLKRKKAENTFDRSMLGELDHTISNTSFMIRFNFLIRVAYIIPLVFACASALIIREATWEQWLFIMSALLVSLLVLGWEQKAYNTTGKKYLLELRKRLTEA